ncbi:laccase, multicopper oxidase, benzenediol:oxygen oxidorectuctase [Neurospora sp. IMI 360204]|nr:laccase, multicopper oxidase, benzenediol:oxygen oxidorectuctase [Neurospora sp. IMI 360204]
MKFFGIAALVAGLLAPSLVLGAPAPGNEGRNLLTPVDKRQDFQAEGYGGGGGGGCNSPSNRQCWSQGFNINTDYELGTPNTGNTRRYTLDLTETDNWTGPDGVVKEKVMMVNGKIIGPTLQANWGDYLEITVINRLKTNGTSIHWHGMHQRNSNIQDGVNGVTECPIPPNGGSKVYRFRATQYGTSWYHSHFSAQYGNGIVGSIVINGPASANYDVDLGPFPLMDYYYKTADQIALLTQQAGPPPSDNVLFNGFAKHPTTGAGQYATVSLTKGKKHRLRLINTSVENHFQLSLVNHSMTIISADLVPVQPYKVDSLLLGVGQRYDVIIDANQAVGNYWFNVTFGGSGFCGTSQNPSPAAIFRYQGAPNALPTNQGIAPLDHQCLDLNDLKPVLQRSLNTNSIALNTGNTIPIKLDGFVWRVNGTAINVDWNKPVLEYVLTGNTSYPQSENIVQIDGVNQWKYWLIENDPDPRTVSLPHPIHLHGHDFLILGRSPDVDPASQTRYVFDPAVDMPRLKGNNPTRRDVAMLPARGWLLIAFRTDNPGAWLMHCHIAWHVSGGLSNQFLERAQDLKNSISDADKNAFNDNCNAWRGYFPANDPFPKPDSGLRVISGVKAREVKLDW